jgi:hypothetical protein
MADLRQAQLETKLDDDGESSRERSGADEGSGERSRAICDRKPMLLRYA